MTTINDEEIANEIKMNPPESLGRVRYFQSLLMFTVITTTTCIGTSLNIAILSMSDTSNNTVVETYDWDKEIHGYILSSISWGTVFVQILGGILVSKHGVKMFLLMSVTSTSILMMLIPWAASVGGWQGVCVIMGIQGLCAGIIFPAIHAFLGKWVPVNERTRLGMFIFSGYYFGMVISPPIAGMIGTSSYGWPWIFYLFGFQSLISALLWYVYGSNSPADCKMITQEERAYIEESLKTDDTKKENKTPWKAIFTSIPFYALIFAQIGGTWGFTVLYNETPSYFNLALGIDLQNSGFLTSLGYINALIFTVIITWAADYLQNKNYLSNTSVRKLCNTLGSWGAGLCMFSLAFIPANYQTSIVVIVVLMAGLDAITTCGFFVNHVDLSPRFAGILYGIASTMSDSISSLAPIVTGLIIGDDSKNLTKWGYVYIIGASMYLGGSFLFICYGTGERQSWDDFNVEKEESKDGEVSIELLENKDKTNIEE